MNELRQEYIRILSAYLESAGEADLFKAQTFGISCVEKGMSVSEVLNMHFNILETGEVALSKDKLLSAQRCLLQVAFAISIHSSAEAAIENVLAALYDETVRHFEKELYELQKSKDQFSTLVQTIPDIVYLIDKDGIFHYINNAVRSLGYEPQELIGKHFSCIIFSADLPAVSRTEVLKRMSGKITGDDNAPKLFDERRTGKRKTTGLEVRLLTKKREMHNAFIETYGEPEVEAEINSSWLFVTEAAVQGGSQTKDTIRVFFGTGGVIRDITARKQLEAELRVHHERLETLVEERTAELMSANNELRKVIDVRQQIEEALKDSEERFRDREQFIRRILESVDEGFIVIDRDYKIILTNKAYCEQMKLPENDIVGRQCHDISHRLDKPCFYSGGECAPAHTFKTGMPHFAVHTHYDSKGEPLYIETKSFPMTDSSGKIVTVIETMNNITEKRRLEEQLRHTQKMESIGTLAGGIAHDFNNMLHIITGYAGLMQMRMKPEDPLMDHLKQILTAGESASYLTKGLLAFSRKQVMEIKNVNLKEVINGFKKMLARIIGEDIDLRINLYDEDLIVKADIAQINQMLMNLATNARDAMSKGGILTIETAPFTMEREFIRKHGYGGTGRYALITVSDTGAGMNEKTRERIFEPYFTTKDLGKGTGLGLSIVYGIVRQHAGYINCSSDPGKGATFRIYIPLAQSDAVKGEDENKEVALVGGGPETILVAEDNEGVRKLTTDILEAAGYAIICATDGDEAVNKFKENKDGIQLLLFDVIMPNKSGKDAYEDIKGIRHDIKAIFMSGYTADNIQGFGIEDGIDFISKPVSPNELLRKIRELLDK